MPRFNGQDYAQACIHFCARTYVRRACTNNGFYLETKKFVGIHTAHVSVSTKVCTLSFMTLTIRMWYKFFLRKLR